MSSRNGKSITAIAPASNAGAETIEMGAPYVVDVKIEGVADILFHRYECDAVAAKAAAAKGSKAKKSDNVESYVYRNDEGEICLPGEYLRQAIIHAAKFKQDPRSSRKSAMDLYKAGVIALTNLATLGVKDWDYLDRKGVRINNAKITRERPAMKIGWGCTIQLMVNVPEYIRPHDLHDTLTTAGRLIGVGDFRPTYGRFIVKSFDIGLE